MIESCRSGSSYAESESLWINISHSAISTLSILAANSEPSGEDEISAGDRVPVATVEVVENG